MSPAPSKRLCEAERAIHAYLGPAKTLGTTAKG